MFISRFWIFSLALLILVGCAIPLQRGPGPEDTEAESAKQDRNLAPQSSSSETESSDDSTAAAAPLSATAAPESTSESAAGSSVAESANVEAAAAQDTVDQYSVETVDLAALDQTFLETIDAARDDFGQINQHRFLEVVDERSIIWQGEALIGDTQTVVLMQPMQAGGQVAARLDLDVTMAATSPEFEALIAQLLATVDVATLDSFGPPDAEIQFVRARESSPGLWSFDVRLNHPDTGWEDYTDGWHVETLDGQILGVRILLHPHVNEMPFSRSQGNIAIPAGETEVQIRSHDLVSGYGQQTVVVPIGESGSGELYEVSR